MLSTTMKKRKYDAKNHQKNKITNNAQCSMREMRVPCLHADTNTILDQEKGKWHKFQINI